MAQNVSSSSAMPDMKYNKWGAFRWSDVRRDYGPNPTYLTLGMMSRYFRKGATVLKAKVSDPLLRATVLENPDATMTAAIVNHGAKRAVTIGGWDSLRRPVRVYAYDSSAPSLNSFGDLPGPVGTVSQDDARTLRVEVPEKGMVFLTTDYQGRTPSVVADSRVEDGILRWTASADPEHCYYRVFKDGRQIASTVATSLPVSAAAAPSGFRVVSVDKWGNEGK